MLSEERLADLRDFITSHKCAADACEWEDWGDLLRDRDALAARVAALLKIETAAEHWSHWGKVKVMHVLTCAECERLEGAEDRWCEEAAKIGRAQLDAARALNAALAPSPSGDVRQEGAP